MKQKIYQFENFILDQNKTQLFFRKTPIFLTSKNFELLSLLVESSSKIFEKKEIFDIVWSDNFVEESKLHRSVFPGTRILSTLIINFKTMPTRRLLKDYPLIFKTSNEFSVLKSCRLKVERLIPARF